MTHALFYILLAFSLGFVNSFSQSTFTKQKKELQRLRSSIEQTQKKIDALSRSEKTTRRNLSSYQQQRHHIATFIARLETELQSLKDSVAILHKQIEETRASLESSERAYNSASYNMMRWKTEHQGIPDASIKHDALFRQLSNSLVTYRNEMLQLRDSLSSQENLLEDYTSTQQGILVTKSHEQLHLSQSIAKSSTELQQIRSNKSSLIKQLEQKRQSAIKLRTLINKLVAEEARKAAERKARKQRTTQSEAPPVTGAVRGFPARSLPWPTQSHSILNGYGMYRNPSTGTMLDNPGIDIKTGSGSTVSSVGSGEVSSVTFLPGFGSLVIIDHGNGVRSVYANLSEVSVVKGAKVNTGSRIGASGENIDGELLHFELWHGRSRQNPSIYLR